MGKRVLRKLVVLLIGGSLIGFGGCLNVERLLRFGAFYGAAEFLLDNDQILDIFPDSTAGN